MFVYKMVNETNTRECQYTDLKESTHERCRERGRWGEGGKGDKQAYVVARLEKMCFKRIK